ncbi:flavin-containing monooxygenase [Calidithermus chliarophilus]|uniref:flavin-containing monooxygenase n=1 Tax=Calidithermus chliarophilus TaxID=52023 RepID=UPI0003FB7507|nr:NAD(P)/FAD-dependent oxidoreductase [Calidithermus chliarophilus]
MKSYEVLVIGGGQAGLAAGYFLRARGVGFAILEAGLEAVGSWPAYYDSLGLFSPAKHSSLPGMPFPGDPEHYPSRAEVIAYLRAYRQEFGLPVVPGARVRKVVEGPEGFDLFTESGAHFRSRAVIAASGAYSKPYVPLLPGQRDFRGRVLHSSSYRSPEPFAGRRVVVVGAGNSAVQIAVELAQVARVSLAVRAPVAFAPKHILGRDFHDWLKFVDRVPLGHRLNLGASRLVWDNGEYRAALERGQPDQRPMFGRFTPAGVVWADGNGEAVDTVIFATGFRPNLDYLAGTRALEGGRPLHRHGVSTTVPGLYYVGLPGQRSVASATLRGVGADAALVVRHLEAYLRRPATQQLLPHPQCC